MVTKFLPLPDNNGGHQRSLAIARRLAELGELVLCGYDDGSADRDGLRDLGIDVRAVPWQTGAHRLPRQVAATRSVSAGRFWSAAMVKTLRQAADEKGIDLLQVEYQQMVPLVLGLPAKHVDPRSPQRRVGPRGQLRARPPGPLGPVCSVPRRPPSGAWSDGPSVPSITWSWSASRSGRGWLPGPLGPGAARTVGSPQRSCPRRRTTVVAFVATMGWAPNMDAALWLAREIWPQVRAAGARGRAPSGGQGPDARGARPGRRTTWR